MRIVFVGTLEPHPGGSGIVNAQVLRGLAARGHEIDAFAPLAPLGALGGRLAAETPDTVRYPHIRVTRYDVTHAEIEPQLSDPAYIAVEREAITAALSAARIEAPDVVICGRESFARYIPEVLPWAGPLPWVVIVHSTIADGAMPYRGMPGADGLRERLASASALLLVAEHQRSVYATLGVPLHVASNGVELDLFRPSVRAGGWDIVVSHVSNMKEAKRPFDLVDAAEIALQAEPLLRFAIVGDGPLLEPVRDATVRRGIAARFDFSGWVERSAVPGLLRQADMAVLMSEREALPCAVLEAMATGLPVVSTDIPATRELLGAGGGVLYPVGDTTALARLLVQLVRDPDARRRIGAEGRREALRRDLERTIDGHERALTAAVIGRSGRPVRSPEPVGLMGA